MMRGHSSPRFLIVGSAARYGSRDEIIGSVSHVEGTAETIGMANRVAAAVEKRHSYDDGTPYEDFSLRIVDTAPRSAWSPAIAQAKRDEAAREALLLLDPNVLPF